MTDLVSNETIAEITQTFWGAFLPEDSALVPATSLPDTDEVRARVIIEGAWEGTIEVSCSRAVAEKVASAMFAVPAEALDDADIADAAGELANVVGGNIKSILPAPTNLSTPLVDDGGEWRFACELTSEVLLSCAGEPVVVRVWHSRTAE
jgi:chemotaxis protein CheX